MHDYAGCTIPACPWCISYGDGYAQGKVKILEEVRARLTMPHGRGCGCWPCRLIADVRRWALPARVPDGPEPQELAPTDRQADGRAAAATAAVRRALRRGRRLEVGPRPLPPRTRGLGVANLGFPIYIIFPRSPLTHTPFHLSVRICIDMNCIVGQPLGSNTAHTFRPRTRNTYLTPRDILATLSPDHGQAHMKEDTQWLDP